jgi:FkbM family methyltransferase
MKKRIKYLLYKSVIKIIEKINNQQILEAILQKTLNRMNFGMGGDFSESGELFVAKYIKEKLENEIELIIFDVGANVGNYSKMLSDLFTLKTKIFAFEPSAKTYNLLLSTIVDCKNVYPNNFGFSDIETKQTLFTDVEGSYLASVYQRNLDHFGINMSKTEEIKLRTIDAFCAENNIDRINFLKLDIEGHELSALRGTKQMIKDGKIDYIQFEFGGCNIDSRTYFQDFYYLMKDNYKIYRILNNGIYELSNYKEIYEVFITVNYLAIRK